MVRDHLGLFDTPPSQRENRFALAAGVALIAIVGILLPMRNIPLPPVQSFIPAINAVMFANELIVAALLYAQAMVFRSRALTVLAAGYVVAALLLIPHALTFPGAFGPHGVLGGGLNSTAWLAMFRRFAFPIAVILYALLKTKDLATLADTRQRPAKISGSIVAACTIAAAASLLGTAGHALLPPFFVNRTVAIPAMQVGTNLVATGLTLIAMALLFRPRRSALDVWLLLALSCWLAQSVLIMWLRARFTLGFYSLFGLTLISSLMVMIALIAEFTRLYVQLALSTAARERERETRLMSMDAVAAAIAHEVGQPLAAISLNTTAGLEYLKGETPNTAKAIQSLRETQDAGRRAFDVVKSVRAMFSKGMGVRSKFDLNDLTLETTTLLDREITAHKVALEMELDPALPKIDANRVQVQRILINLITNAIEAMKGTRRTRSIAIRTARTDRDDVLLEVTDSGVGIPTDKLAQIFEPFVTTKKSGTGLGLSLCRTIVEEHGGKLWATSGARHGVTFHLEMPGGRGAAR